MNISPINLENILIIALAFALLFDILEDIPSQNQETSEAAQALSSETL